MPTVLPFDREAAQEFSSMLECGSISPEEALAGHREKVEVQIVSWLKEMQALAHDKHGAAFLLWAAKMIEAGHHLNEYTS